jgi:hypothetical protein
MNNPEDSQRIDSLLTSISSKTLLFYKARKLLSSMLFEDLCKILLGTYLTGPILTSPMPTGKAADRPWLGGPDLRGHSAWWAHSLALVFSSIL